jgi:DNA-binding NtrC family response regulator
MIFLGEDDDELRGVLADLLRAAGHQVEEASDGNALQRLIAAGDHEGDLVISDLLMPGRTGLQLLEDLHDRRGSPRFILMTGYADEEMRQRALRLGALAVLEKPMALDALWDLLPAGR